MKRIDTLTTPFGTVSDVHLELGNYATEEGPGPAAVTLWTGYGEKLATVSVHLPDLPPLPEGRGWFYAKAYGENAGLPEALAQAWAIQLGEPFFIGPFRSLVYRARVTREYR